MKTVLCVRKRWLLQVTNDGHYLGQQVGIGHILNCGAQLPFLSQMLAYNFSVVCTLYWLACGRLPFAGFVSSPWSIVNHGMLCYILYVENVQIGTLLPWMFYNPVSKSGSALFSLQKIETLPNRHCSAIACSCAPTLTPRPPSKLPAFTGRSMSYTH